MPRLWPGSIPGSRFHLDCAQGIATSFLVRFARVNFQQIFRCTRMNCLAQTLYRLCSAGRRLSSRPDADAVEGNPIGSRLRIPHGFMDGGPEPVETGHRLSALGCPGALGLWRSALPVLPARFVGARRSPGCASPLETRSGGLCMDRACSRRMLHVPAGCPLAPRA